MSISAIVQQLEHLDDRLADIIDHLDQLDHLDHLASIADALTSLIDLLQAPPTMQFRPTPTPQADQPHSRNCQAGGQTHGPPAQDWVGRTWYITLQILRNRIAPASYDLHLRPTTARIIDDVFPIFASQHSLDWIHHHCERISSSSLSANGYYFADILILLGIEVSKLHAK